MQQITFFHCASFTAHHKIDVSLQSHWNDMLYAVDLKSFQNRYIWFKYALCAKQPSQSLEETTLCKSSFGVIVILNCKCFGRKQTQMQHAEGDEGRKGDGTRDCIHCAIVLCTRT